VATTSWATIRKEIAEEFGFFEDVLASFATGSANFAGDAIRTAFPADDSLNGWFAHFTVGTNAGQTRRVIDHDGTGGIVTHSNPLLTGADAATALPTVQFHRVHPTRLVSHFNRAAKDMFPQIGIVRDLQTIVTGQQQYRFELPSSIRGKPSRVFIGDRPSAADVAENLLSNPGFEDWTTGSADNWGISGTGVTTTQEEETTTPANYAVLAGASSTKLATLGTNEGQYDSDNFGLGAGVGMQGVELNFSVWVYCVTASVVQASLFGSGVVGTPVNGGLHTGTGWELLTVTAKTAIATTTVRATVRLATNASGYIAYVDEAICIAGQSGRLDRPWTPLLNWNWVPPIGTATGGGYIEFPYKLPEKKRLRVIATDMLSSVSADTDLIEIDGDLLQPLYDRTRELAANELSIGLADKERSEWQAKSMEFRARWQDALNRGYRIKAPNPRSKIPNWSL
jgi:hypothetical protein